VPGGLGLLVSRWGLGVVAPVLVANAFALVVVGEATRRRTGR
jgi:hypothetical protein